MIDFETQYIFCKDNRLVRIMECLFAKASTPNAWAWALEAPPSSPGATAHLHLKQHTQNQRVWDHTLKVPILTSYKNVSIYCEQIFHIYALKTSETYFTSCRKEHNRSPLTRWGVHGWQNWHFWVNYPLISLYVYMNSGKLFMTSMHTCFSS